MDTLTHPTPEQEALYARLLRRYGKSAEWETLTHSRRFERMSPHRAAHFIQRLLDAFIGHRAVVSCGCTGQTFAADTQERPAMTRRVPAARVV